MLQEIQSVVCRVQIHVFGCLYNLFCIIMYGLHPPTVEKNFLLEDYLSFCLFK